jgi:predicted Zn-ribbon and HTH transcriptional regulator
VRLSGNAIKHRKRKGEAMTSQQKRMIEFSDLVAFCFTCKECGVSLSIPASANLKNERPSKCPSCDEVWMTPSTGSVARFLEFKEALLKLRVSIENDKTNGFILAIEISPDPISTAKG